MIEQVQPPFWTWWPEYFAHLCQWAAVIGDDELKRLKFRRILDQKLGNKN